MTALESVARDLQAARDLCQRIIDAVCAVGDPETVARVHEVVKE